MTYPCRFLLVILLIMAAFGYPGFALAADQESARVPLRTGRPVLIPLPRLGEFTGIAVDKLNLDDAALVHRLANAVPGNNGATIDGVYKYILDFGKVPAYSASSEEIRQLRRAEALLFQQECFLVRFFDWVLHRGQDGGRAASVEYERYFEYANAYARLLDRLSASVDPVEKQRLVAARDALLKQWQEAGRKDEVERAIMVILDIKSRDPNVMWAKARQVYAAASARKLPLTRLSPQPKTWISDEGWRPVEGDFAGIGADNEYKLVDIIRPWFAFDTLLHVPWRWNSVAPLGAAAIVSDGTGVLANANGPIDMQLVPQQIVLIRRATNPSTAPVLIYGFSCDIVPALPPRTSEN